MKKIEHRLIFLIAVSSMGLLGVIAVFIRDMTFKRTYIDPILFTAVFLTAILFGLLARGYGRLKTARLIVDNKILYINAVQIEKAVSGHNSTLIFVDGMEVFISCFGILIGSKIIKFNMDSIRLKEVEIGCEYISLFYGTDRKTQKVSLLHGSMDMKEIESINGRFSYETGVIPVVMH